MRAIDFWRSVFRSRYVQPGVEAVDPADITAHYARFFRGHHGPCSVDWDDDGASWSFPRCPHLGAEDVCEVHQGFLLGLFDALLEHEARLIEWRTSKDSECTLEFAWG